MEFFQVVHTSPALFTKAFAMTIIADNRICEIAFAALFAILTESTEITFAFAIFTHIADWASASAIHRIT